MEHRSKRPRLSRVQAPHRRAFDTGRLSDASDAAVFARPVSQKGIQPSIKDRPESQPMHEMKGRRAHGDMHRKMHRRQLALSSDVVVTVNIIATVDGKGNTIGVQTILGALTSSPVAAVTSVVASILAAPSSSAAVSSAPALPSVPSVPLFPSDLTVPAVPQVSFVSLPSVPAFPFTTTTNSAISTADQGSQVVLSSPLTTSPATTSLPGLNSTISLSSAFISAVDFSSTLGRNSSNTLPSTGLSNSSNSTILSTFRLTSHSSSSRSSEAKSSSTQTILSPTTDLGSAVIPAGTAAPSSTSTAASGNGANNNTNHQVSTSKVVGGVVGGLAGLAVLLLIALFLLRRHRREQQGAIQLSTNDTTDTGPIALSGQPMAQRSSVIPAAATAFFNRFSSSSKGTVSTGGGRAVQERGFQKISGRKLPSAFSEGMNSDSMPFDRATLSSSSFYRDSEGFYGGPGVPVAAAASVSREDTIAEEKMRPSPARTPVIHHADDVPPFRGGPSNPPLSPVPKTLGTLGRSHPSFDGSRGSKFTEDV